VKTSLLIELVQIAINIDRLTVFERSLNALHHLGLGHVKHDDDDNDTEDQFSWSKAKGCRGTGVKKSFLQLKT